jgi:HSP20 family molecular chaperone IbpA
MSEENRSQPDSDHESNLEGEIASPQRNFPVDIHTRGQPEPSDVPQRAVFTPPIDIYEDENGLVLYADLPGVTSDSLNLQVQDNKLTLFGRVSQTVESDAEVLHREYETGDFLRSFILSDEVDHERITAGLNNGVLKVVLPKLERGPARQIPIQTG